MSTIASRLDPATRERLLGRLDELRELDRLLRERGRQRPPDPPPALTTIATTEETP